MEQYFGWPLLESYSQIVEFNWQRAKKPDFGCPELRNFEPVFKSILKFKSLF